MGGWEWWVVPGIRSIFANSHSLLHSGHTERVLSHLWIQSRWNTWPQQPNAIERPFSLLGEGLAWYSIDGSFKELRQIAHVSAQMSQLHLRACVRAGGRVGETGSAWGGGG